MLPDLILGLMSGPTVPKAVPAPVIRALLGVTVTLRDDTRNEGSQGFQLRFTAQRDSGLTANYALLSDPLLQPGNRVVITVTIRSRLNVLMDGVITHQQLDFAGPDHAAELQVTGHDIGLLLDLEQRAKSYEGMKQEAVVQTVLQPYSRYGISADVKAPPTVWPTQTPQHIPFQQETDRQFLRKLASANGYLFAIRPDPRPGKSTAVWAPPEYALPEQSALSVDMGINTNVERINFTYDALAPAKVAGGLADVDAAKAEQVDIMTTKRKAKLAKNPALSSGDRLVRKVWLAYAGPDLGEATARAQSMIDRSTDEVVKATGSLDTLVYGELLRAPGRVGVRGAGATYDGLYRVMQVEHNITLTSYKQNFSLAREGTGTNVRRVSA
jgi:phage protein D